MHVNEFDYILPEQLIAQTPLRDRASSRLFVLHKKSGKKEHRKFHHVLDYFKKGDVLVLNNTKVIPARLFGVKEDTGAKIEILLLKEEENYTWETLVKPAKRVKEGTTIQFGDGLLKGTCVEVLPEGRRKIQFSFEGIFNEILEQLGNMPLPPYIQEQLEEKDRYQTVYAKVRGSAAAPTAGLHFTEELLEQIREKGVTILYVTLHVGLGTFRPVSVDVVEEHEMHEEYYEMNDETAHILNEAKQNGERIIAVGTTSVRVLETVANKFDGTFKGCTGWTNIFIYPGYTFRAIDGMITNFHLPKSTLVMLVSAFAGKHLLKSAYEEAIRMNYRFFSFGDAMLII